MSDNQFLARTAYLRIRIEQELGGRTTVLPGQLERSVAEHGAIFGMTPEEQTRAVRHLETIFGTKQDDGHLLRGAFVDWYPKEKALIDFYYWRRLEKHWHDRSILPIDVIRSVDQVTDEIMGFLGNPRDKTGWNRRRGLVMGHVQMGKTTNYSALISKAADAGYRIIIVLAGITNSLRYQTQVRLDKTFVGKSSISDAAHSKVYEVATAFAGREGYVMRHPYCGTTQLSDFNTKSAKTTGAHEGNFADPILFVTKKNPKVLERLGDWLKSLRHGERLDGPMLLIDDEASSISGSETCSTRASSPPMSRTQPRLSRISSSIRTPPMTGREKISFQRISSNRLIRPTTMSDHSAFSAVKEILRTPAFARFQMILEIFCHCPTTPRGKFSTFRRV
jgi:hypothetical protein